MNPQAAPCAIPSPQPREPVISSVHGWASPPPRKPSILRPGFAVEGQTPAQRSQRACVPFSVEVQAPGEPCRIPCAECFMQYFSAITVCVFCVRGDPESALFSLPRSRFAPQSTTLSSGVGRGRAKDNDHLIHVQEVRFEYKDSAAVPFAYFLLPSLVLLAQCRPGGPSSLPHDGEAKRNKKEENESTQGQKEKKRREGWCLRL